MPNATRRMFVVLALLLLFGVGDSVFAQGRLRGTVKDRVGEPIEGVKIQMVPAQSNMPTIEATSSKKGKFVFGLIRNADYRLVAFKDGMRIYRVDANIAIPEDDDYWTFNEDVVPGAIMPQFNVTGVSVIEFDLKMEESPTGPGQYGTGIPVAPTQAIIEAMQEGRLDEAIEQLENNLSAKPDSPTLHYLHSFALKARGDLAEAMAAANRCLELDSAFEGGYLLRAKIYEDQGQADKAIEAYESELGIASSTEVVRDSHLGLAALFIAQERHDDAIATLEKMIEMIPDHAGAHKELADLYTRSGQQEKAAAMIEKVTALGADDPNILYNLGAERFNAGDFEAAAEYFTKTIEVDATYGDAYMRLAFTRLNLNDREGAKENLEKYLELSTEETQEVQTARAILEQLNKQ